MQIQSSFSDLDAEGRRQNREIFKANPFINGAVDSHKELLKLKRNWKRE